MADYQKIVEYLRDLRSSPVEQVTDEMRQSATEFAELCSTANDRLRQCSVFLQQGLRTEAIHLAEEAPNLLDLVAALDLPDAEAWVDFCKQWELPVPQMLQMDRAAQLNEAYNQDQSLEDLLKRHRLMALARAPIRSRLEVMRQIASQDPNPYWDKDIREFERARLKELRGAAAAVLKSRDQVGIADLAAEIEPSVWLEPIPGDLGKAVNDVIHGMHRKEIEQNLHVLLDQLRAAYAARNQTACGSLLVQYRNAISEANGGAAAGEIPAELAPIAAWLDRESNTRSRRKAFIEACQAFAAMAEDGTPIPVLQEAFEALGTHGEPVPAGLAEKLQKKIHQKESRKRARLVMLGATAAFIVVAAVVAGIFVFKNQREREWVDKLKMYNVHKDTDGAEQTIADMKRNAPALERSPEVQNEELVTRQIETDAQNAATAVTDLQQKVSQVYQAAIVTRDKTTASPQDLLAMASSVDTTVDSVQKSMATLTGMDDASKESINHAVSDLAALAPQLRSKAVTNIQSAADGLTKGIKAVKSPPDMALADGLKALDGVGGQLDTLKKTPGIDDKTLGDLGVIGDQLSAKRNEIVKASSTGLSDKVDAIVINPNAAPTTNTSNEITNNVAALDSLGKDQKALFDVASATSGVLADTLDGIKGIGDTIANKRAMLMQGRENLQRSSDYAKDLRLLGAKSYSAADLKNALGDLAAKYAGLPTTQPLSISMDRAEIAKGYEAWHAMLTPWASFAPAGARDADARAKAVGAFVATYPHSQYVTIANTYLVYLKAASATLDKNPWPDGMADLLGNAMVTNLKYLQTSDGKTYYILTTPNIKTNMGPNGQVTSVTFDAIDPQRVTATRTKQIKVVPPVTLLQQNAIIAPHAKFANDMGTAIKTIDEKNWDTFGVDLIDQIQKSNMNVIIQAILMERAIKINDPIVAWALGDYFSDAETKLTNLSPETNIWFDPDHPVADSINSALLDAIKAVPSAADARKKIMDYEAQFKAMNFDYAATAILLHDETGAQTVMPPGSPADGMTAWAVGPVSSNVPAVSSLVKIGVTKGGKFILDSTASQDIPDGTMVYITK